MTALLESLTVSSSAVNAGPPGTSHEVRVDMAATHYGDPWKRVEPAAAGGWRSRSQTNALATGSAYNAMTKS
jgi:hypothetical protein